MKKLWLIRISKFGMTLMMSLFVLRFVVPVFFISSFTVRPSFPPLLPCPPHLPWPCARPPLPLSSSRRTDVHTHTDYLHYLQPFDFSFEEEDAIDGMKGLIVQEVNSFRAAVRGMAPPKPEPRKQDTCVAFFVFVFPQPIRPDHPYTSHPKPLSLLKE